MSEDNPETLTDLQSYYEREAALGSRGPVGSNRHRARSEFIELLQREGRTHIVDFGSGPGHDLEGFAAAGITGVGIDLAIGNARLAVGRRVHVVCGSIMAPPFAPNSFAAGWSMSTFMHVPEAQAADVASAMAVAIEPGGPLMVGLWGGPRRDEIDADRIEGERRLFSMRTLEHNAELLRSAGAIEHEEIWDVGPDGWEYHLFRIRVPV